MRADSLAGKRSAAILSLFLGLFSSLVYADGSAVDKVYHPYVEALEWELEWRMILEDEIPETGEKRRQLHRLGLGKAITETVFAAFGR